MQMPVKKVLLLSVLILILSGAYPAYGQDLHTGKYAGEFLNGGVGARALGMGGAFTALSDDGTSGYWNPAGLSGIEYPVFNLMHASRFSGEVNYDYFSFAMPYKNNSSIGLSIIRLGIDDIPDTRKALLDYGLDNLPDTGDEGEGNGILDGDERLDINRITYFSNVDYAVFLSYGKIRSGKISYGANVKMIRRKLAEYSAFGMGFDVGMKYRLKPELLLGVAATDITGTLLAWNTSSKRKEVILPGVRTGIAYSFTGFRKLSFIDRVTPAVDMNILFENRDEAAQVHFGRTSMDFRFGVETQILGKAVVRAGYNDVKQYSFGAGFRLPKLNIDYAYSNFSETDNLGDTHRISISLRLEETRFRRKPN